MDRNKIVLLIVIAGAAALLAVTALVSRKDGKRAEQADVLDSARSGVVVHELDKAYQGYNIYCSRGEPVVYLIDMAGKLVHQWSHPGERIWVWDHVIMLENGDVVVINKFRELLRLDWNSKVVWKRPIEVHHDVVRSPDNTFYAIVRELMPYRQLLVRFPSILHLTDGAEGIDRWSTYEQLEEIKQALDQRSFLDTVLDSMLTQGSWLEVRQNLSKRAEAVKLTGGKLAYDYFHLNTISILPDTPLGRRDSKFGPGNLLICFRNVNQIAVLDWDTKQILWAWGEGVLEWPHHPTMLENGNILVFDNGVKREYSTVIELNPVTNAIEWEYLADPPESFYTYEKGSAQRLPNGNTLICDGDNGRAFEVTKDGEIVWEWLNPHTKRGHRVQVYRMTRLSPEMVDPLLADT
jgi:hypothetical protein